MLMYSCAHMCAHKSIMKTIVFELYSCCHVYTFLRSQFFLLKSFHFSSMKHPRAKITLDDETKKRVDKLITRAHIL